MTRAVGINAIIVDTISQEESEVYISFDVDCQVDNVDIFFYVKDEEAFLEIINVYKTFNNFTFKTYKLVYADVD